MSENTDTSVEVTVEDLEDQAEPNVGWTNTYQTLALIQLDRISGVTSSADRELSLQRAVVYSNLAVAAVVERAINLWEDNR